MLDHTDIRLLKALQKDARLTSSELGDILNLSPSQSARRRAALQAEGYIDGFSVRLDPVHLGLNVQAFVQVSMVTHTPRSAGRFQSLIRTREEVVSAWTLTGEADYLLRVYCADLQALNRLVHEVFLPHDAVARVQSQIVMDQTKADAPLPIHL